MSIRYNTPQPYRNHTLNRNRFREERNQAMNKIFDKYNLPRNMANNQIKRRVKYHDWVRAQLADKSAPDHLKQKYIEFLMDRTVFNEKKRKDVVKLAIDYGNRNILSLRSPVVIAYLQEIHYLYGSKRSLYIFSNRNFYKELQVFGKFREDKAFETVLKKRIAFLRKLKRVTNHNAPLVSVPREVVLDHAHSNEFAIRMRRYHPTYNQGLPIILPSPNPFLSNLILVRRGLGDMANGGYHIGHIFNFMTFYYPIPPHTNSTKRRAATTIQKTVRGMLNRKTLKKQAAARTARAERKEKLKSRKRKR